MPTFSTFLTRGKNLLQHGAYIPTEYFVFDERRIVYISIPKVACTSIKLAIEGTREQLLTEQEGTMGIHNLLTSRCTYSLNRKTRNYAVFAFVRNPFDRLVSCYEDKIRKPLQHNGQYYFASAYNRIFLRRLFGSSFHDDMSFDEFIKLVSRIPDAIADGHFKSQYSSLYKRGAQIPQFVGKFESLNRDWSTIASKLGLNELTSNNKSRRTPWMDYYQSKEIIELAYKRFRKDIETFDYEASYRELLSRNHLTA